MGTWFFLDAQMDADGRWVIPIGTVSAFVKTAQVPNCPQLRAEPYAGVAHTSVRPAEATKFCLFCGVAIALARMHNHVAMHLQKGEVVTEVVQARAPQVLYARKLVAHAHVWSH